MKEHIFQGVVIALLVVNLLFDGWVALRPLPVAVITQMSQELGKRDAAILLLQSRLQDLVQQLAAKPGGKK